MAALQLLNVFACLIHVTSCASTGQTKCAGKRQSPIDINKQNCKPCPDDVRELQFTHYWDTTGKATVTNDGHTAKIFITCSNDTATLTGGPLDACYELKQIHFHWGAHDNVGSEHTINGHSFSMEVHFVHEKKGSSTDNANHERQVDQNSIDSQNTDPQEDPDDDIAVLAFFLQVSCTTDNERMDILVDLLSDLKEPNSKAELQPKEFLQMFKEKAENSDYFTYLGSLTTEPFSENVIWLVNPKPIPISHNQVEKFRHMQGAEGKCIKENHRSVQDLNGRCVFYCSPTAKNKCDRNPHTG